MSKRDTQMSQENIVESPNEVEVDMGAVSMEDPVEKISASGPAEAGEPKKRTRKAKGESAPKKEPIPRSPIVGEYGKNGLPTWSVSLTEGHAELFNATEGPSAVARKHHQRQLIYTLLTSTFGGEDTTVDKIVLAIEGNPEYLTAMKTNQPISRCVFYQLNELEKLGIVVTAKQKRERKAAEPAAEVAAESVEPAESMEQTA